MLVDSSLPVFVEESVDRAIVEAIEAEASSGGNHYSFFHVLRDKVPNRRRVVYTVKLPRAPRVAHAWLTEEINGHSHFGAAVFLTYSVQLSGDKLRLIGYLDDPVSYHGGIMITIGW